MDFVHLVKYSLIMKKIYNNQIHGLKANRRHAHRSLSQARRASLWREWGIPFAIAVIVAILAFYAVVIIAITMQGL